MEGWYQVLLTVFVIFPGKKKHSALFLKTFPKYSNRFSHSSLDSLFSWDGIWVRTVLVGALSQPVGHRTPISLFCCIICKIKENRLGSFDSLLFEKKILSNKINSKITKLNLYQLYYTYEIVIKTLYYGAPGWLSRLKVQLFDSAQVISHGSFVGTSIWLCAEGAEPALLFLSK